METRHSAWQWQQKSNCAGVVQMPVSEKDSWSRSYVSLKGEILFFPSREPIFSSPKNDVFPLLFCMRSVDSTRRNIKINNTIITSICSSRVGLHTETDFPSNFAGNVNVNGRTETATAIWNCQTATEERQWNGGPSKPGFRDVTVKNSVTAILYVTSRLSRLGSVSSIRHSGVVARR